MNHPYPQLGVSTKSHTQIQVVHRRACMNDVTRSIEWTKVIRLPSQLVGHNVMDLQLHLGDYNEISMDNQEIWGCDAHVCNI